MIHQLVRTSIATLLIGILAAPMPALAQKNKEEQKKENQKVPKNSDVENIGNRDINKGIGNWNLTSLEKEIALGRQLAADIERQVKLIEDPRVNEYVNRVGQNLVRNSDAKVPFTIKVVDSDEINAFALPGGFFYVNSGLILAADDEAELAGVMAHEIAHVTARHGTENATRGQIANIATLPLIFLGGAAGYGIRQAAGFLIPMQFLKFSRGAESEADFLGVQYLYKTGYDPGAAVSFFEKLQARETARPGTISEMFSSHPPTGDRIENTKKNIEVVLPDKEEYVVTTSEFQKIKAHLAQLENRRPLDEEDNKPSLRRKTTSKSGNGGAEEASKEDKEKKDTKPEDREPDPDQRPTLKRKPGGGL
jgi:predicted Zn-dependent protease